MEKILYGYSCFQSLIVTNKNRPHYQRLFGERVPFTGIIARQNTLSLFNDFCLSLYLSRLKSSTQEYMQSIKELIIEEKCSYIVMHMRLDIGMFVDFCSSVARGGEDGGPNPPLTRFPTHWIRLNPRKKWKIVSSPPP